VFFTATRAKLDLDPRASISIPSKTHHSLESQGVSPTTTPTRAPNSPIFEQHTTPPPSSPLQTTLHRFPSRPESPLAHARRGVGSNVPPAQVETFPTEYRLSIALPRPGGAPLAPEMITIAARRGARLSVVADAWHLERDCGLPFPVPFILPLLRSSSLRPY
jgi:hypothetical protein